ncbi:VOC family protein [Clostridium estertheticum]|uniref:VOC family protein n=1 Tax=Clostridium estertheticum TaxID=238834 RepID=UPI0013E926DA|nr:VOC family protein [Clostridium estertheticum]MBZ9685219.1 VOC family protein [Clostridium estertheticum]
MLIKKLMHVCIAVPDLNEALKFYRDVLGFQSVFQTENDKADGKLLGFDTEEIGLRAHHLLSVGAQPDQATEINIIEYTNPKMIIGEGPYNQMNHVGITRLALLVDNVDEALNEIRNFKGVEIVCETKDILIVEPEVTITATWCSFKDPFGIFITLSQPPKVEPKTVK